MIVMGVSKFGVLIYKFKCFSVVNLFYSEWVYRV